MSFNVFLIYNLIFKFSKKKKAEIPSSEPVPRFEVRQVLSEVAQ